MTANDHARQIHSVIIGGLLVTGACPGAEEIRDRLALSREAYEEGLRALDAMHGIVLHPGRLDPWLIHPFSLTPSATWVAARQLGWWAPCLWCGLGVATLAGGAVEIHTRVGGEAESVVIPVVDGVPQATESWFVHFTIRPADAWNNVHEHCAQLLPFRSPADAAAWSQRHGLPFGEVVTLEATAALARRWYGRHADRDWHKWSIAEAQEIFASAGFTGSFWDLSGKSGRF